MAPRGATFDEKRPPWTRGDFRGFRSRLSGRPSQTRHDNPLKASRPSSFRLLSPFGKGDLEQTHPRRSAPLSRWFDP